MNALRRTGAALSVIEFHGVTKTYGRTAAIQNISFSVSGGEVFGYLGPNGSGKSTSIRLMLGLARATAGRLTVLGHNPTGFSRGWLRRVGFIPGEIGLPEDMTGRGALRFYAGLTGVPAPLRPWACEVLCLTEKQLARRIRTYSKGMKQKLAIVQALQHDPELLILDEPTSGLDPLVQNDFMEALRELRSRGKTIFFSSHVLSEVEGFCDRVAVLREGRVILDAPVGHLLDRSTRLLSVRMPATINGAATNPPTIRGAHFLRKEAGWFTYEVPPSADSQIILADLADVFPLDFRFEPDFDEAFLELYRTSAAP